MHFYTPFSQSKVKFLQNFRETEKDLLAPCLTKVESFHFVWDNESTILNRKFRIFKRILRIFYYFENTIEYLSKLLQNVRHYGSPHCPFPCVSSRNCSRRNANITVHFFYNEYFLLRRNNESNNSLLLTRISGTPTDELVRDSLYRILNDSRTAHLRDNIRNTTHFNHIANKTFFTRLYTYAGIQLYIQFNVSWNIFLFHDSVSDWETFRLQVLITYRITAFDERKVVVTLGTLKFQGLFYFRLLWSLIACK